MELSSVKLVEMFRSLLLVRRLEEKSIELCLQGQVPGWLHPYLGQEGVAVGVVASLRPHDLVASTHRGRGHFLAKGMDPKLLMAEVLGKRDGVCRGRGGEMHLALPEQGVIGSSGIVGGILSVAVGVAFASQYQNSGRVVACFFGDGASNQGTFHESLNLASVWQLPIVFVCENNGYGEFTPQRATMRVPDVSRRALAYDIPGITVDGDDVLAVYQAAGQAAARARDGGGPTLLECRTHRWLGHFLGDAQKYRTPEELEEGKRSDPVARLQSYLLEGNILTPEGVERLETEVGQQVAEAVEFALNSPLPSPEEALQDVYLEELR